ncbi:hypothetical protein [Hymenobacter sp. 5414T-23]|uniref:hypothetical protein n=1 Tax=Hymenobacter sp. 5414T-23 TaxID=2932252 RepID=UPI001FD198AA|nr:hypothetical protein [Hymenobacter sp. 5414T-23]UOQ83308.1 hypothetical protein MUN83_21050 [Hymenobacter sp. 5414T-23]
MTHSGIVVNRQLPQLAKLSKTQFLDRVANIQAIRRKKSAISLFISDARGMAQLEALHEAVHTEKFFTKPTDFELSPSWIPFVLAMPEPLRAWLAAYSLDEIKAQVVNWMGALYAAHCRRDSMWRKLLPEIKHAAMAYYSPYRPKQADELIEVWNRQFEQARCFVGGQACGVLENPFADNERPFLDSEEVDQSYRFTVRTGYFREDDWLFVVERDRQKLLKFYKSNIEHGVWTARTIDEQMRNIDSETMNRSEARPEIWQAWHHYFSLSGDEVQASV